MENKFIHEMYLASLERTIRRWWILCILLTIMLVGSNGAWLYYESQFVDKTTTESIEAEQKGDENIVSLGDVSYGTESEDNSND